MANTEKIKLYKLRGFSQKLNATIELIRQNISILSKSILLILLPMAIINGFLLSEYMNFIFSNLGPDQIADAQDPFNILLNSSYVGFILLSILASVLNLAIVMNFMDLYDKKYPETITISEIFNASMKDIIPLFLFGIIAMILVFAGFILLIIPGIYLMIVLSLAMPAFFFERKGIFHAIKRALIIIKGKMVEHLWYSGSFQYYNAGSSSPFYRAILYLLFPGHIYHDTGFSD